MPFGFFALGELLCVCLDALLERFFCWVNCLHHMVFIRVHGQKSYHTVAQQVEDDNGATEGADKGVHAWSLTPEQRQVEVELKDNSLFCVNIRLF